MAPPSGSPSSQPPRPAGTWAQLWLGGGTAAVWLSLLLADSLPWTSTATAPASLMAPAAGPSVTSLPQPLVAGLAPQPLVASLAPQAPAPLRVHPNPWLDNERPGANERFEASQRFEASPSYSPPAQRVETATPKELATPAFEPAATRQHPLPGSLLLGGPLNLASLNEKAMVPAARVEQALRATAADRLSAVPHHWRPTMEALIQTSAPEKKEVLPAEVVHLPAPHLQTREEYPLAMKSDGVAETTVTPSAPSRQALERWAQRQSPTPEGSVRPVMVVLEPLAAEPQPTVQSAEE